MNAALKKAAVKKPAAKKAKATTAASGVKASYYDIVRVPVITEKSTAMSEQNKVVFKVSEKASKDEIKAAVEAIFGVKVKKVNTLNRKGKAKGFRGTAGRQADVKKAIITLEAGQHIDMAAGAR